MYISQLVAQSKNLDYILIVKVLFMIIFNLINLFGFIIRILS